MLLYPDFFRVGISLVGPPDFRSLGISASNERFFGIPGRSPADDAFYETISNTRLAQRLQGKLLLVYGGIDENVPLNHAFLMFDALIHADKDFDSLIIPNSTHAINPQPYAIRRMMQYFLQHLGPPQQNNSER